MILSLLRRLLALVFGLTLLTAVVSYGAVEPFPMGLAALGLHLCLIGSVTAFGLPQPTRRVAAVALTVLVALTLWVVLQTLPLPGGWMAHPSWAELDVGHRATISVTPGDDWVALLGVSMPFSAFLTCLILFDTDKRAMRFLNILVIGIGLIAAVTLVQFVIDRDMILFLEKHAYRESFTGSFINRNTAATLFGMMAVVTLALAWRTIAGLDLSAVLDMWMNSDRLPPGVAAPLRRATGYGILLALFVIALFLTKSRAGIGSSLVGLGLFVAFRLARGAKASPAVRTGRRRRSRRRRYLRNAGIVVALLSVAMLLGSQFLYRIEVADGQDARFCAAPAILAGISDNLPFGAGLASFRDLFPTYRDPACGTQYVWSKAHNVYLEGLFAIGLLFPILAAAVLVTLTRSFLTGMRTRRRYRSMSEAGLAVLTLVVLHSTLDFSLQIPGFAVMFAAILGPLVTVASQRVPGASWLRSGSRASASLAYAAEHKIL